MELSSKDYDLMLYLIGCIYPGAMPKNVKELCSNIKLARKDAKAIEKLEANPPRNP